MQAAGSAVLCGPTPACPTHPTQPAFPTAAHQAAPSDEDADGPETFTASSTSDNSCPSCAVPGAETRTAEARRSVSYRTSTSHRGTGRCSLCRGQTCRGRNPAQPSLRRPAERHPWSGQSCRRRGPPPGPGPEARAANPSQSNAVICRAHLDPGAVELSTAACVKRGTASPVSTITSCSAVRLG